VLCRLGRATHVSSSDRFEQEPAAPEKVRSASTTPGAATPWSPRRILVLFSMLALLGMVGVTALVFSTGLPLRPGQPDRGERELAETPLRKVHTDHAGMMQGPFKDGPSVTRACLDCHPDAARDVATTAHYTWLGEEVPVPGRGPMHARPTRIGKANLLNNFCLNVESNWERCTSCHAGYGWRDADFDFSRHELVDCLVCHEQTGTYRKGLAGLPERDVDLLAAASSVAAPTRRNCGACHFAGGGGDAVKHGDLDGTFAYPREHMDVHMGRLKFECVDCHRTEKHQILGRSMSVSVGGTRRVACRDCHGSAPHRSQRLNAHAVPVACTTCHVPLMALDAPTKMVWDWSTAGKDVARPEPHRYLKEKGSFVYRAQVVPEYYWYDGTVSRYLKGDPLDPERVLDLNPPRGARGNPKAQIWPFKVHRGKQPFDREHRYLLVAKTWGPGGYWTTYDWESALRLGAKDSGLPYSGQHGFVATRMYWPLAHMVQPRGRTLGCPDCHGARGRLDWERLGYEGDPAFRGSGRLALAAATEPGAVQ
jgi:octaheme c-type cytochrome (tetrathionate reductase family)